jgi:hypothetical protein
MEGLQVQADSEVLRGEIGLQLDPASGSVRQASEDKQVYEDIQQSIKDIATVFDMEDAGSATYSQIAEGGVPERAAAVRAYVDGLLADIQSGQPQRIAYAKKQAKELLAIAPVQLPSGGYRVRRRALSFPGLGAKEGQGRTVRARQATSDIGAAVKMLQQIAGTN